jgi:hypothetical protein
MSAAWAPITEMVEFDKLIAAVLNLNLGWT